MPARNKSFDTFRGEDAGCRQYASSTVAGQAENANNRAVGAAVLGTVLGAGLGAAIGGGRGAAIGAGSGAIVGTSAGASGSSYGQETIQGRYDIAYSQCMYSRGNQVPGPAYPAPVIYPGVVYPGGVAYPGPPPYVGGPVYPVAPGY